MKSRHVIVKLVVYGIDQIACISKPVDVGRLTKIFPDYSVKQLYHPSKCDILLLQANASLMSSKRITVGDLVLWDGPLGVVVSGSHHSLEEESLMAFSLRASSNKYVHQCSDSSTAVLESFDFETAPDEVPSCYRCRLSLYSNVKELIQWFQYEQIGAACIPKLWFLPLWKLTSRWKTNDPSRRKGVKTD